MGRKPCCEKEGVNRGAWTAMEDKILTDYISLNGEGKWRNLPISAGLKRCGKSCRLRWLNYLKPDIKRGNITREEEDLIIRLHKLLGNRWSLIAGRLPGRTDNEIKNYWNTNIGKKLQGHVDQNKPWCLPSPSLRCHKSHQKTPTPTCVVRTRATRCTKVVIPEELQNFQTKDNDEIEKKTSDHITINNNNNNNNGSMETVGALEQGPVWALNESIPSDMKIDEDVDVDMDGHILSKILDDHEFFPFSDLQHHHHHHQQQQNEDRMSSPLMNDNLFLGEDVEGELDIDWITRFLETELIEETSH